MYYLKDLKVLAFILCYLLSNFLIAQDRIVTGTVISDDGPLPGVNVLIMGTTYGNITDLDGNYTMNISNTEATLVFSYIGYKTVYEVIGNRSVIDVYLPIDITQLEEVVVTGYTTQAVRNFSGAIDVVDTKEMKIVPTSNVAEQLQGRAPGVTVTQSGMPGAPISVRIRGYGTINDNDPLYIIDGAPADHLTIEMLNPDDVETVQVLKDASAASVYGSRAANGVVLITTKSAKATGKTNFSFNGYVGVQHVLNLPEVCNPDEVALIYRSGHENAGVPLEGSQFSTQYLLSDGSWGVPDYLIPAGHSIELDGPIDESLYDLSVDSLTYTRTSHEGTDWLDQIFRPALIQNYFLSATHGSEKGQFAITLGYFDQEGVINNNKYQKLTFRVNTLFNVGKRFRIGETFSLSYHNMVNDVGMHGAHVAGNILYNTLAGTREITPVYDVGGYYTGDKIEELSSGNPVAGLERGKDNYNKYFRLLGSFFIELDILKDLTLKSSISPNLKVTYEHKEFDPKRPENSDYYNQRNHLSQYINNRFNWTWYNTLSYHKTFNDIHNLLALVGMETIEDKITTQSSGISDFYSDDISYRHLSAGESDPWVEGISSEWSLLSFFAKVDYNYKAKYIVSATVRRDGSSRFGEENKYAVFPAFSAAWRISAENFMRGLDFINDLKLRAGWGQTGNQNIGNYRISNTYATGFRNNYDIGGLQTEAESGVAVAYFGNPDTKWESTTTLNVGIDLSMFRNSLTFTIDWYDRYTTDMLISVPPSALKGQASLGYAYQNVGEMRNTGIDFSLFYRNQPGKDFTWNAGINFTHYKNEVVKLYNPDQFYWGGNPGWTDYGSSITMEGYPISSFFGLNILGIFHVKQEVLRAPKQDFNYMINTEGDTTWFDVGRWRFEDKDGNDTIQIIAPNEDDRYILGSPHPDFTFGIPINLQYRGFYISMFWYGSFGNELYNGNKRVMDVLKGQWVEDVNSQFSKKILQSWGMPGVNDSQATLPEINDAAPDMEFSPSLSYYVEDGSFLRLQQLILGYNFNILNWKMVNQFRVYFQVNNLLTITNFKGFDPMVTRSVVSNNYSFKNDFTLGSDLAQYPGARTYMVGLSITF